MKVFTLRKPLFAMVLLATSLAQSGAPAAAGLRDPLEADFNGDGYADLAVGVPFEDVDGQNSAGAINVIYGSPGTGLGFTGNRVWTQNSTGIDDQAEADDMFGWALAAGDFNGDGFGDLAIGIRLETIGGAIKTGAVQVLLGSPSGLTATGSKIWSQNTPGVPGTAESYDCFGCALAADDFNDDGMADLAIGAPEESEFATTDSGAVYILYGSSPGGLTTAGTQVFNQNMPGSPNSAEPNDGFGFTLTTGDFNGDGVRDLGVGIPYEEVGGPSNVGAVAVIYGLANVGLTSAGNQFFHQNTTGIAGDAEKSDLFGAALATGDFDGDGIDDLAVGAPQLVFGAGEVVVVYGTAAGVSTRSQLWTQATIGVKGIAQQTDSFGSALAAGDFDGDAIDDLAIGVFGDIVASIDGAGAVNVLYGEFGAGLMPNGNQLWDQGLATIQGDPERYDFFGYAVAAADFNRDGFSDLAIGVTNDRVAFAVSAGGINVLYGQAGPGLTDEDDQMFNQYFLEGAPEAHDSFGFSLAATGPRAGPRRSR